MSEPSSAALEIARLAGFETVVFDVEHGTFDLAALDQVLPLTRALGLESIVKVLGPERGPIQQALDLGADAVAIPHIASAAHAAEICGFAKFPPLGDRSFAGGRTSAYRGFSDDWVREQDERTRCYAMIEDASAFAEIQDILALDVVDGIFIGPSDLSLRRDRGAYTVSPDDLADLEVLASRARAAGKPWILPAWSEAEQRLAIRHGAHTVVASMQYGALLGSFTQAVSTLDRLEQEEAGTR